MIRSVWIDYDPPAKPIVAEREVFQGLSPSFVYQFPGIRFKSKTHGSLWKTANLLSALILVGLPEERFLLDFVLSLPRIFRTERVRNSASSREIEREELRRLMSFHRDFRLAGNRRAVAGF